MTYRNQWASLKGSQTLLASFDHYYHPLRSSFGAVLFLIRLMVAICYHKRNLRCNTTSFAKITDEWFFVRG